MASTSATAPSAGQAEESRLLEQFLDVLRSPGPTDIPESTLFGAITHYLATLSSPDLDEFVAAALSSPVVSSITSSRTHQVALRQAVRLSVSAKIDNLNKLLESAYFSDYRRDRRAKQWVQRFTDTIISADPSNLRTQTILGLVEGLNDVNELEWGRSKVILEEELIIEAATVGESEDGLNLLCSTLQNVDHARLQALNLKDTLPRLRKSLQDGSRDSVDPDRCSRIAKAIGVTFEVLNDSGHSSRVHAWQAMGEFCIQSRAPKKDEPEIQDPGNERTALLSFLHPATSIIDILIASEPPSLPSSSSSLHTSAEIAIEILLTLSTYSDLLETSEAGLEGYHRVLFGALDVLEAKGGVLGVTALFQRLKVDSKRIPSSQAAYILRLAEQLVHQVDGRMLRDTLFPLAHHHVTRGSQTTHEASFEAAHAMILGILQAAIANPISLDVQTSFVESLSVSYARLLIVQAQDGDIKSDQLRAAYPIVAHAASLSNTHALNKCRDLVINATESGREKVSSSFIHAARITRIAITPYIPREGLSGYFDDLTKMILATDRRSRQRSEMAEVTFHMVVEGLPDESKRDGMEWWLKWRDEIQGTKRGKELERARL